MTIESRGDYLDTICQLVEYEVWCNLHAVDFLSGLSADNHHRDFGFGLRSPHRTLSHIADVMRGWSGCVGPVIERPSWLPYDESLPFEEIRRTLMDVGGIWLARIKESHELGLLNEDRRLNQVFHFDHARYPSPWPALEHDHADGTCAAI